MGRMLEQEYQPTEAAFAIALMAAGRLGKADFAKTLFAKRTAAGLEPKEEIYSSVSGLCCRKGCGLTDYLCLTSWFVDYCG